MRRCRNHQFGAIVTDFGGKSAPDARILGLKIKQPVREQQDRPIKPQAEISRKRRVAGLLLANSALNFA